MRKRAFTLVELIVVITILAILATIGFVSFSGYLAGTRDANRIAQIKAMSDALELYRTKKDLPIPDDKIDIQGSGSTFAYQGFIGANVLETIEYTEKGLDPKDKTYFTYFLTKNKKYFQLLAYLEEPNTEILSHESNNKALKGANAIDYTGRYTYTKGNKLGIITDESNIAIQEVQSIVDSGSLDVVTTTDTYIAHVGDGNTIVGSGTKLQGIVNSISAGGLKGSCAQLLEKNNNLEGKDGIYSITPNGEEAFSVYCDMTTDGGGWTYATMLADTTTQNLFKTNNADKIISLTEDISSKGQISDIWRDNGDKDLMLWCETNDVGLARYEKPLLIYSYEKKDIGLLEQDNRNGGTKFSSKALEGSWDSNKFTIATTYWGSGTGKNFYLGAVGTTSTLFTLTPYSVSASSSYQYGPAYGSAVQNAFNNTDTYCMSAIR